MLRTLRDAFLALIVERSVSFLVPSALPYAWTTLLLWLTWDVLRLRPVRKLTARAYSALGSTKPMLSYALVFVIGGALACVYWWASSTVFSTWSRRINNQFVAAPAITPAAATATVAPAKLSAYKITATPFDILGALQIAGPLQKEEVANSYVNGAVDWKVNFVEVKPVRGESDKVEVTFAAWARSAPYVTIIAPRKGNEYLGNLQASASANRHVFRVTGVINEADYEKQSFRLRDASFELLPPGETTTAQPNPLPIAPPSTTPREEGPKVVPPAEVTLGELLAVIKGRSPLQATKLLEPYAGIWTVAEGEMIHSPLPGPAESCVTTLRVRSDNDYSLEVRFGKQWCDELDQLKENTVLKVRGKLEKNHGGPLVLSGCERR